MARFTPEYLIRCGNVAAAKLDAAGERKYANDVRRLLRSNAALRTTAARQYGDIMELRHKIGCMPRNAQDDVQRIKPKVPAKGER
jgi:hypothetical protein